MERKRISTVARQFKRTFSQQALNGLGKSIRFCMREREITPYRLALGLIEVFAEHVWRRLPMPIALSMPCVIRRCDTSLSTIS